MKVLISTVGKGEQIEIEVEITDTIEQLKCRISKIKTYNVAEIKLQANGIVLSDNKKTLAEYKIKDKDKIFLTRRKVRISMCIIQLPTSTQDISQAGKLEKNISPESSSKNYHGNTVGIPYGIAKNDEEEKKKAISGMTQSDCFLKYLNNKERVRKQVENVINTLRDPEKRQKIIEILAIKNPLIASYLKQEGDQEIKKALLTKLEISIFNQSEQDKIKNA